MSVSRELLDRQFPIESADQQFALRSAGDYADRLASKAQALLKHSPWSIAQIGYSLGFEDPVHFNHCFKKQPPLPTSERKGNGLPKKKLFLSESFVSEFIYVC